MFEKLTSGVIATAFDLLNANELQLLRTGTLVVPSSAVQAGLEASLGERVTDVQLDLSDGCLDVRFLVENKWPSKTVHIRMTDLAYAAGPGLLGTLEVTTELSVKGAGTWASRIIGGLVLGMLKWVHGDAIVLGAIGKLPGVTVEGNVVRCQLEEMPRIKQAISAQRGGIALSKLARIVDIRFVDGGVKLTGEPTDLSRALLAAAEAARAKVEPAGRGDAAGEKEPGPPPKLQSVSKILADVAMTPEAAKLGKAALEFLRRGRKRDKET